jgi:peptidyl-prolyl cis-trans isomerase C
MSKIAPMARRWVTQLLPVVLVALICACGGADDAPLQSEPEGASSPVIAVAEVNGVSILSSQVDKLYEVDRLRLSAEGESIDPRQEADLRRAALDLAINGELVYQAALAQGIRIPAAEIDRQLEVVRSQFASDDEFDDYLEASGSGRYEQRGVIERRLMMAAYVDSITDGLSINEEEVRRVYEERRDEFVGEEQIRAAQILIRVRPQDPAEKRAQARERIEEARRRVRAGEDFAQLAREISESPLAEQGGDLGYFPRGRMLPEFEQVVFELSVGELSPVFETPYGFNLVKVLDRKQPVARPFDEVKTELFMVLARERRDGVLRERVEQLRGAAEIRILDPDLQ